MAQVTHIQYLNLPLGLCDINFDIYTYHDIYRVPPRCHGEEAFKLWHVAFHGTMSSRVKDILSVGDLLMPGLLDFVEVVWWPLVSV